MPSFEYHPIVVHFPIVLLLLGTLTLALALLGRPLERATLWLLGTGVLSAGAAILTGEMAEDRAEHVWRVPEGLLERHEDLAWVATILFAAAFVGVLLWQRQGKRLFAGLAFALAVIGYGVLAYDGHLGGEIVYEHAVPQSPANSPAATTTPPDND